MLLLFYNFEKKRIAFFLFLSLSIQTERLTIRMTIFLLLFFFFLLDQTLFPIVFFFGFDYRQDSSEYIIYLVRILGSRLLHIISRASGNPTSEKWAADGYTDETDGRTERRTRGVADHRLIPISLSLSVVRPSLSISPSLPLSLSFGYRCRASIVVTWPMPESVYNTGVSLLSTLALIHTGRKGAPG